MRIPAHILAFAVAFTSFTHLASAQQAMLMGRVTDANNKPVKQAGIFLKGDSGKGVAISDSLGLYSTQPMPDGKYKVKVVVDKQVYTSDDVTLSAGSTKGKYYHFRLAENKKAIMTVDTHNPFMEQRVGSVNKPAPDGNGMHVKMNSNGKIIGGTGKPGGPTPRMR